MHGNEALCARKFQDVFIKRVHLELNNFMALISRILYIYIICDTNSRGKNSEYSRSNIMLRHSRLACWKVHFANDVKAGNSVLKL